MRPDTSTRGHAALLAEVALQGVAMEAPVHRRGGAGPSDDGHVLVNGANAALPLNPRSQYAVQDGRLLDGGADTGLSIEAVRRPAFYDLATADGVPYEQIARLHGADVLATTVVQTCIRYAEQDRCRFCAIEESLRSGATIRSRSCRPASGTPSRTAAGSAPSRNRCAPARRSRPRPRSSWPRSRPPRSGSTGCARW